MQHRDLWASLVLEAFFALLPLLVIALLWQRAPEPGPPAGDAQLSAADSGHQVAAGQPHPYVFSVEWSASAMVLFGLTIVRLFRAVRRRS